MATSLPCLVFDYGGERQATLYGASDGAYRPCEIGPLLTSQRYWVTAQGWVLAWDPETSATFLWDPQDPDDGRVTLPPLAEAPPARSGCVLSGDPTSTDGCTVVIAAPYGKLWFCHTGSAAPAWARYNYNAGGSRAVVPRRDYHERNKRPQISRLAPYRGKFYYTIGKDEYGVLEFSPWPALTTVKTYGIELTFPPGGEQCLHASSFLLDLDDELHMVWIFFADMDLEAVTDIAVYKMGFAGSTCVRVDNIGDRAILAASTSDFAGWCDATKFGVAPNTVYWMSHNDKHLHVYDIGTNTEEVHECQGVAGPSCPPFWLLPVHRP
ncbi:unnamed protein product [Alopecurus aequalis]